MKTILKFYRNQTKDTHSLRTCKVTHWKTCPTTLYTNRPGHYSLLSVAPLNYNPFGNQFAAASLSWIGTLTLKEIKAKQSKAALKPQFGSLTSSLKPVEIQFPKCILIRQVPSLPNSKEVLELRCRHSDYSHSPDRVCWWALGGLQLW